MRKVISLSSLAAFALTAVLAPGAARADEPAATDQREQLVGFPTFMDVGADVTRDEVAGEIAVDVRDDASAADLADIARTYGIALTPNSPWSDTLDKIEIASVDVAREPAILDALSHDPRVEHAEAMSVLRASFIPNDPLYAEKQWHLKRAGAEKAWEYACGLGVTVAIIDTGVACYDKGPFSRGSDLTGTRCEGGYDFVNDRDEASDDHGHGTHVAGTVAQTTDNGKGAAGLAYCARLMPIKVLTRQGWGSVADVAEGIRFAADNGAQVINLSLGGNIKSRILEDAVIHAHKKGVTIVAAAGNSGRSVGWPAAYEDVIAVSATDANDRIAWFSSRGPEIAIGAPGVGVTQQTVCNGGRDKCELFGTFNGTSMASPHVAGAAAMLVGLGVTEPSAVRAALAGNARAPKEADSKLYGAGILDAGAAASHVFWMHFMMRSLALVAFGLLVARRIKKRGGAFVRSPAMIVSALIAGVGLVPFAPLVSWLGIPHAGAIRFVAELAARPFGEWDLLAGAGFHRALLLASALPSLAFAALFFGVARFRPVLGGFALGSAALMTQLAISGDAAFILGSFAMRVWTIGGAMVCLWLARIALDSRRAS